MGTDIDKIYREELGRGADASGRETYAGMSEEKLRKVLRNSDEYKARSSSSGASGCGSSGGSIVHRDRGNKFDRSGMKEIRTTETGITDRIDLGSADQERLAKAREKGAAILYDDATGKLYATSDWSAVEKNWDSLVDINSGQRQKLFGISSRTDEKGNSQYYAHHAKKTKPFGVDVTVGYNEVIPEAGTEEFQNWVNNKFYEGVAAEKAEHRWTQEEGWGGNKPGFGDYFSVSYEDWMAAGAPRKVGGMKIQFGGENKEENREIRQALIDNEGRVDPNFMLGGANLKDESHGFTKALNTVGSIWGNSDFGEDAVDFSNKLNAVPVLGSLSLANKLFLQPIAKYEAARDAGESSGTALHETGSYMLATSAKTALDAAIVSVGVLLAPVTAGLSAVAAGAALGAMNAAGGYAIDSVVYGGTGAELMHGGDIWNATGKSAAAGAITAGVAEVANTIFPNAGAGYGTLGEKGSAFSVSYPTTLSSAGHATLIGAGQYVNAKYIYGADDELAFYSGIGGMTSAYGQTTEGQNLQHQKFLDAHPETKKYLADSSGNCITNRSPFDKSSWSYSWGAFKEVAAESPLTSWAVGGKKTATGRYLAAAEAGGFNRPGVLSSLVGLSPYGKMFGFGKNNAVSAMGQTARKDFINKIVGKKIVGKTGLSPAQFSDLNMANTLFDLYYTKQDDGRYGFTPQYSDSRAYFNMMDEVKPVPSGYVRGY